MRSLRLTLLTIVALSLVGCSNRLNPGTEVLLDERGATELSAHFIVAGRSGGNVSAGTKVRVVKDDSPDDGEYRKVKVLVLEGDHRNENCEVTRKYVEK